MILEELIINLRAKRNHLKALLEQTNDAEQRAYLTGRLREVEELLAQLEEIA